MTAATRQRSPRPDPAFCPGCERFIGPADVCPYCNADSARSPALRRLRAASLLLALLGLLCLYAMAGARSVPRVPIGSLAPAMNYGTVRVRGTVARPPFVGRDGGAAADYLSLRVRDASGEIQVVARDEAAQAIAGSPRLPEKGDVVEATGSVRVRNGKSLSLYLRRAEDLALPAKPAEGVP